jgi:hypothetical protein
MTWEMTNDGDGEAQVGSISFGSGVVEEIAMSKGGEVGAVEEDGPCKSGTSSDIKSVLII